MGEQSDRLDLRVAQIAARQHGVVAVAQLHEVGIRKNGVTRRVKRGQLHRVHQGVYAVGHRGLSLHGRFMAAVLACGNGAVLSHVSAAVLWGLLKPIDGPVHVSIPTTSGRTSRRGIRLHRCPSLTPTPREPFPSPSSLPMRGGRGRRLTTHRHNILVTTIPRTIEDLRTTCSNPTSCAAPCAKQSSRDTTSKASRATAPGSDLESLFLDVIHPHRDRIPPPEVNKKLGRWTVDFLWRPQKVVVETDFWTYHRG